jgi:hypothetical protein
MKPSILIIYYSQTGQLKSILDQIFLSQKEKCDIDFVEIKPVKKFEFPWQAFSFFDCMPESVLQIPEEIEPINFLNKNYDLVVLGYQPWFLSPSIPLTSFLKSKYAYFLKDKNILTVIGARNMWLNAQEKTKESLLQLGAHLKGNIVLVDSNPNLTSVLTIMRWTFKGQKEASRFLPEAGVQQQDISSSQRFGDIILQSIQQKQLNQLHENLLLQQSITLKSSLIILERRGIKNFRKFATYIKEKGDRGNPARKSRVNLFSSLLFIGVFVLSPISAFSAFIASLINQKSLQKELEYFKNISYKEKAI